MNHPPTTDRTPPAVAPGDTRRRFLAALQQDCDADFAAAFHRLRRAAVRLQREHVRDPATGAIGAGQRFFSRLCSAAYILADCCDQWEFFFSPAAVVRCSVGSEAGRRLATKALYFVRASRRLTAAQAAMMHTVDAASDSGGERDTATAEVRRCHAAMVEAAVTMPAG